MAPRLALMQQPDALSSVGGFWAPNQRQAWHSLCLLNRLIPACICWQPQGQWVEIRLHGVRGMLSWVEPLGLL